MRLIKGFALITLALAMSTAGYASRLAQDNDDYGQQGDDCTSAASASAGFACVLDATKLFGEQFVFSGNSNFGVNFHVWDFQVISNISDFTLTLALGTNDPAIAHDQTLVSVFDSSVTQDFLGYSIFQCQNSDESPSSPPAAHDRLCTTSDGSNVTANPASYTSGSLNSVSFTVTGNGNGLVFYVVDNLGDITDPTVTASITSNNAVPEPASIPILAGAGLAIIALGRRRLAKLL